MVKVNVIRRVAVKRRVRTIGVVKRKVATDAGLGCSNGGVGMQVDLFVLDRAPLESAFHAFGGVPRELLFDQMRAVVIGDDRLNKWALVMNAEFLRFAAHWDFGLLLVSLTPS